MRLRHAGRHREKAKLAMTAMIDIVFLLLIFFIMTFRIVAMEGDFDVKMPPAAIPEHLGGPDFPPISIHLTAGPSGQLTGIRLGERPISDFQTLRERIREFIGDDLDQQLLDKTEVNLHCDHGLRYEHVIDAITAVSGWVDADGHVHKMITNIKFAPPRAAD